MKEYLIYTNKTDKIPQFSLFKVIDKKGPIFTIAGKTKKGSIKNWCLYKIDMRKFPKGSWVDLDSFLDNCDMICKTAYRTKPVLKKSIDDSFYEDRCYMKMFSKPQILVAKLDDMWLLYDGIFEKLNFIESEYADDNWAFEDNFHEQWDKETIKNQLVQTLEKKIKKELFDEFEK